MKKFSYIATTKDGKKEQGVIESESKENVSEMLRKKSLSPVLIREEKKSLLKKLSEAGHVSSKEKVIFSRELATLVNSGVPISQAMHILEEQVESNMMKKAVKKIAQDIDGGFSLSEAMKKHENIFSPLFISMVHAGEVGGILDKALERMAEEEEKNHELKAKIRGALAYPAVIMIALLLVVIYMITNVIPQIAQVFSEMGGELPASTRFLISVSDAFRSYGAIIIAVAIAAIWGARILIKSNRDIRYFWHLALLKLPILGKLITKINIARFSRTLGSLLSAGVAVIESLNITAETIRNEIFKRDILDTAKKVEGGSRIAENIKKSKFFPKIVSHMITVGEDTGSLSDSLLKVTEFFEKEVDYSVKNLSSILEPLLMIIIGLGAGFIVISVITPIYQMTTLF